MSLYLDEVSKQGKKPTKQGLLRHFNLLIPVVAVIVYYAFKHSYVPLYVVAVSSLLLINALLLVRRSMEFYFCMFSFFMVVLAYAVLGVLSTSKILGSLIDLAVVLSVLFTYTYYRYTVETRIIFKQYTPLVVLVSTVLGVYLGVKYPLRYLLLAVLDAIASNIISTSVENAALKYIISALFFALLYSSPLVDINLLSLIAFALLHIVRNTFMYSSNKRWKGAAGHILGLDIALKPLLVAFT